MKTVRIVTTALIVFFMFHSAEALPHQPASEHFLSTNGLYAHELLVARHQYTSMIGWSQTPCRADLVVTNVTAPNEVSVGIPFRVSWTVQNSGGDVSPAPWQDKVYLADEHVIDDSAILLGTYQKKETLGPCQTYSASISTFLSFEVPVGRYCLLVKTDADDAVSEGNEENNVLATAISVGYVPEYTITPSAGLNGSLSPDNPVTVYFGYARQFRADPDIGYRVDTWYLDGHEAQTGGNTYTLSNIQADHTVHVSFRRLPTYSLGEIEFADDEEFATRIAHNNFIDPDQPEYSRSHVERVEGLEPDPTGVMLMRNLRDLNPASPTFGQIINARAKGSFIKTDVDEILIRFKYLFNTSGPDVGLVIYLSDMPYLPAPDDPQLEEHRLQVALLRAPPADRPGSAGSRRFGVFEKKVSTGHLDLSSGLWIELELIGAESIELFSHARMAAASSRSESSSVVIDSLSSAVQCYAICLDINWDCFIDEADFLAVIAACGHGASGARACCEGVFSDDGTVDGFDVVSWDWAMHADDRLLNFCSVPLTPSTATMSTAMHLASSAGQAPKITLPIDLDDMLISGKRGTEDAAAKLKDRLYAFEDSGLCAGWSEPPSERCNIRIVQGSKGQLYLLNSETGIVTLDDTNEVIIPPGRIVPTDFYEPRYDKPATVYVGIQDEGPDSFGRPILDAAFAANYAYVVPVVVNPDGNDPYTAAAKLELLDEGSPPYQVLQLYDDPPPAGDNQCRNCLREIEIDGAGNVYVLNVHHLNESDILWRYYPDGTFERLDLEQDSDDYLAAPIGMYVSKATDMLYLASARYNPVDANSTTIYGFSIKEPLTVERSVTITGMHHVTGITEDPETGSLWAVGFNMEDIPLYPKGTQAPFYYPYLAEVPYDSNDAQLISLYGPDSHDLALPMSIVWTKVVKCGGADLDQSDDIGFADLAMLAECWLDSGCTPPDWCAGADVNKDGVVDMEDFAILTQNWLETECLD